jgi:hypothetical protein
MGGKVTPYRPANGSEGMDFEARFCALCACDSDDLEAEDGCPILADVYASKITDEDYPPQWVEDADGPRCTAFTPRVSGEPIKDPYAVEKARTAYDALPRDPVTGRPVIA